MGRHPSVEYLVVDRDKPQLSGIEVALVPQDSPADFHGFFRRAHPDVALNAKSPDEVLNDAAQTVRRCAGSTVRLTGTTVVAGTGDLGYVELRLVEAENDGVAVVVPLHLQIVPYSRVNHTAIVVG